MELFSQIWMTSIAMGPLADWIQFGILMYFGGKIHGDW